MERVQALADISRSALCCHSNATPAPIANPPNKAQLEDTPYHSPDYIWVRAVVWECREGQTDRHTDGCDQYTPYLKKTVPPLTCYNVDIHGSIATIFGKNVAEKVANQSELYFSPHLNCASALPGETGNLKIASFHLNAACFLPTSAQQ